MRDWKQYRVLCGWTYGLNTAISTACVVSGTGRRFSMERFCINPMINNNIGIAVARARTLPIETRKPDRIRDHPRRPRRAPSDSHDDDDHAPGLASSKETKLRSEPGQGLTRWMHVLFASVSAVILRSSPLYSVQKRLDQATRAWPSERMKTRCPRPDSSLPLSAAICTIGNTNSLRRPSCPVAS